MKGPVYVKDFSMVSVPEASTRVAMLERWEADIIYLVPGELLDRVTKLPGAKLAPTQGGPWWLEFPGFEDPKNPFHDKRVRQAVSFALNRQAVTGPISTAVALPLGPVCRRWMPSLNDMRNRLT